MRKVKISRDVPIMGYRILRAGEEFKVLRHNKRYIYIQIREGLECRLTRKDCDTLY